LDKKRGKEMSLQFPLKLPASVTNAYRDPRTAANYAKGYHDGVDLVNADGQLLAVSDGIALYSRYDAPGWGNYFALAFEYQGKTYTALYCHLAAAATPKEGGAVKSGAVIGRMGSTGNSTGVHLHFGLYEGSMSLVTSKRVDLDPLAFWGLPNQRGAITKIPESEVKKVKTLVIWSGDGDKPAADILAYKLGAYTVSAEVYKSDMQQADKLYVVGGTWQHEGAVKLTGANRTETALAMAAELAK
jgi:murein DD-endopeptidase MepM/ murein hydrolase activator NlpD